MQVWVAVGRPLARREADEWFAAAADEADDAGGMADDEGEVGNRPRHHRAHPDHGEAADGQIVADDGAGADRRPFPDQRRQGVLVRAGSTQARRSEVVARGKRSLVKTVPAEIMTPVSMVTAAQI